MLRLRVAGLLRVLLLLELVELRDLLLRVEGVLHERLLLLVLLWRQCRRVALCLEVGGASSRARGVGGGVRLLLGGQLWHLSELVGVDGGELVPVRVIDLLVA